MPIYEYECTKCGERTEMIQKMSDPPLKRCRSCRGRLERLLSPVGIHFKGSGWYVTDYARKGSGGGSEGESQAAESKDTSKSSVTSSESQTQSKGESKIESKSESSTSKKKQN